MAIYSQAYEVNLHLLGCAGSEVEYLPSKWQVSFSVGEVVVSSADSLYRTGYQQNYSKNVNPPTNPNSEDFNPVITPNGDGLNDEFVVDPPIIEPSDLRIYDKWGTLVFQEINFSNRWVGVGRSGEILPAGVYSFIISDKSGNIIYKGTITLIY